MLPNELPLERHAGTLGGVLDHEAEIGQAVADAVGHGPVLLFAGRRAGLEQARHGYLRIIAVITGQVGRERHHFHRVGLPHLGGRHIDAEHVHELHNGVARLAHGGGLYIYGPRGVGKTEMACRIAYDYAGSRLDPRFGNWAYRPVPKGRPKHGVRFVVSADLMTELRSTFDKGGDSEADVIRRYVNVPVLIIDDLGKDSSTQWVLAKLFQIVNGRYEAERATIVTSQYTLAGLAAVLSEYGRKEDALAIVSGLAEMTERVKMDGPDRRMAPCDAEGAGR